MNHLQVREYYGVKRVRASSRFPLWKACQDAAVRHVSALSLCNQFRFCTIFRPNVPAPLSRIPAAGRHPLLEGTVTGLSEYDT